MKYTIRSAKRHETGKLNEIENAVAMLFLDTKYFIEDDLEPLSEAFLLRQIEQNQVWVAVDSNDQPVGFAAVLIFENYVHLHELSVDPQHSRKGLGTRLTKAVIRWAEKSGYDGVTLSTFREILWNAPFYTRLGFRELYEQELNDDLREIRKNELESGLPADERVLMIYKF